MYCCLYLVKVLSIQFQIYNEIYLIYLYLQNSAAVLSIVSLLHDAKQHVEKYPSSAVDAGTFERSTIYFLTRTLNNMTSACEYSATQAVGHALGLPANYCFHKRCYLFSDRAIEYVKDFKQHLLNPDSAAQDSDISSFSSGVYSASNSEIDSNSSDNEQCISKTSCANNTFQQHAPSDVARIWVVMRKRVWLGTTRCDADGVRTQLVLRQDGTVCQTAGAVVCDSRPGTVHPCWASKRNLS